MQHRPSFEAPGVGDGRKISRIEIEDHQLLVGFQVEIGDLRRGQRQEDFRRSEVALAEMGGFGDAGEGEGDCCDLVVVHRGDWAAHSIDREYISKIV